MNSKLNEKKDDLVQKAVEKDKELLEISFDVVIKYLEKINDDSGECGYGDRVCPEMIANECRGMPFVDDSKIRLILEAMYIEGYLDRNVPEGLGISHYSLKKN